MSIVILIAAMDEKGGIGKGNALPWHLPKDMDFFRKATIGGTVVMGRKTFESVGRPLPRRRNIVITRNPEWRADGVEAVTSLSDALELVEQNTVAFVIGGGEIYTEAMPFASVLMISHVPGDYDCDTFFPPINMRHWKQGKLVEEEGFSRATYFPLQRLMAAL